VDIYMSGYITENELDHILPHLPEHAYLEARTKTAMTLGSQINTTFPVVGLFEPLGLLANMERLQNPKVDTVFIGLRAMYDRGFETVETSEDIINLIVTYLKNPVSGRRSRLQRLYELCVAGSGEDYAETLFEAFCSLHELLRIKNAAAGHLGTYSGGVTQRWITRPLVIKPDLLSPEEEACFMPYIFNIHESEARHDYIDLAGSRLIPDAMPSTRDDPRIPAIRQVISGLLRTAGLFESASSQCAWASRQALSLRLWAHMLRTSNNFYGAQLIRDRCTAALSGEPRRPSKDPTWTGDPNLLAFNEIRRDEFDNTAELIVLLEQNGLDLVTRSATTEEADPFQLEPELIPHLKLKMAIMRDHWLDGERYLTPPFK